jgi:hypothetical protein
MILEFLNDSRTAIHGLLYTPNSLLFKFQVPLTIPLARPILRRINGASTLRIPSRRGFHRRSGKVNFSES